MIRFLKAVLYLLTGSIAVVIAFIIITNKPVPFGKVGPEAEAFTDSLLASVHCADWERLRFISWTYQGKHHYVWDKLYNLVEIKYGNFRVLLNINAIDGIVWKNGERLSREDKHPHIRRAWELWCNDSFWLNPVCKLRDRGVVRRIVDLPDGKKGLLATFTQGGMTPGDSFLWITDDHYTPIAWRMWVRKLPVQGLKASWEQWTTLEGAQVSTLHHAGPYTIEIQDLQTGRVASDLGLDRDPFIDFVTE